MSHPHVVYSISQSNSHELEPVVWEPEIPLSSEKNNNNNIKNYNMSKNWLKSIEKLD